ncbi:hypothetical protein SLEP1_g46272 [Rubroshorea leprosula]|uniref:DUF4057 domain-containing protein n=1 Tax=Rubroshorea leprosula TaxID=152421 RepID=A0AAV5LLP9_9ROSI|nr:hypothetical protein SLEP1_g46272 [Rubroshorea leprosula]
MNEGMAKTVMNRFEPGRVLIYIELANEFAVFDRWFTSVLALTQPNLFYAYSTMSFGAMSNMRKDLIHGFPQKIIFDSLEENKDLGIEEKMERSTPMRKPHRSTVGLLTWSETHPPDSPAPGSVASRSVWSCQGWLGFNTTQALPGFDATQASPGFDATRHAWVPPNPACPEGKAAVGFLQVDEDEEGIGAGFDFEPSKQSKA